MFKIERESPSLWEKREEMLSYKEAGLTEPTKPSCLEHMESLHQASAVTEQ